MSDAAVKDLLLFGGSFDPPHLGHLNLLQNAVAAAKPDLVMVMPSEAAPHKTQSATPWAVRADMCRCFLPVFANTVVSDMETRRPGKSYTWDSVCQLQQDYPGARILLCVGSDMLESFTAWHRWQDLLRQVTLVAQARHDGEVCELRGEAAVLQSLGGRVLFAPGPVVEASSTDIRQRLAEGDDTALALVPPLVADIIREQGLYRK